MRPTRLGSICTAKSVGQTEVVPFDQLYWHGLSKVGTTAVRTTSRPSNATMAHKETSCLCVSIFSLG